VFDTSLFHQSIGVLHNLLVNIFSFGFGENLITCLCEFLKEYFVDESEDVFGGTFDFDPWVNSLHCFLEKFIVFSIAEDLVGIVIISEDFLELLCFLLRYTHICHFLIALVCFDELFGCSLQVLHSIVVIHCFED
jgi:hypothetical protein